MPTKLSRADEVPLTSSSLARAQRHRVIERVTNEDRALWLETRIVGQAFRCERCASTFMIRSTDQFHGQTANMLPWKTWDEYQANKGAYDRPGHYALASEVRVQGIVCFHGRCPACSSGQAWIVPPRDWWERIQWWFSSPYIVPDAVWRDARD